MARFLQDPLRRSLFGRCLGALVAVGAPLPAAAADAAAIVAAPEAPPAAEPASPERTPEPVSAAAAPAAAAPAGPVPPLAVPPVHLAGHAVHAAHADHVTPAPLRRPALQLRWAQVRANAVVVQNSTGNAYSLQTGWTPQLRLRDVPVGLRLLAEFGALRTVRKEVFVTPSAQLLLTWQVVHHLELALGAGVQFWCQPTHLVRPVATLEAHYVPHRRIARVIRSAFVASSLGASSGAGLQVRAGLSLDFHRETEPKADAVGVASHVGLPAPAPLHLQLPGQLSRPARPIRPIHPIGPACPACPSCPAAPVAAVCPPCPAAEAPAASPPEDVILRSHLLFAFNAAALDDDEVTYLHALAAALTAEPDAWDSLEVVGHADAVGTTQHTQLVSEHRTQAVVGVLVEAGVPHDRLLERAVGETQPIVGEPQNAPAQRRVVLKLHGYRGSDRLRHFVQVDAAPVTEPQP